MTDRRLLVSGTNSASTTGSAFFPKSPNMTFHIEIGAAAAGPTAQLEGRVGEDTWVSLGTFTSDTLVGVTKPLWAIRASYGSSSGAVTSVHVVVDGEIKETT